MQHFGSLSAPLFGLAICALWFFARPGGSPRLKLATASALAAAGIGLMINQLIASLWSRDRPFVAHPGETVLVAHRSADPSFPSDHATAAFAIAFAVLFFSRRLGALFLLGATAIGVSRVLLGLHYPSDVLAGAAVGLGLRRARDDDRASDDRDARRLAEPTVRPVRRRRYQTDRNSSAISSTVAGRGFAFAPGRASTATASSSRSSSGTPRSRSRVKPASRASRSAVSIGHDVEDPGHDVGVEAHRRRQADRVRAPRAGARSARRSPAPSRARAPGRGAQGPLRRSRRLRADAFAHRDRRGRRARAAATRRSPPHPRRATSRSSG